MFWDLDELSKPGFRYQRNSVGLYGSRLNRGAVYNHFAHRYRDHSWHVRAGVRRYLRFFAGSVSRLHGGTPGSLLAAVTEWR